jgi:hypothetical protein
VLIFQVPSFPLGTSIVPVCHADSSVTYSVQFQHFRVPWLYLTFRNNFWIHTSLPPVPSCLNSSQINFNYTAFIFFRCSIKSVTFLYNLNHQYYFFLLHVSTHMDYLQAKPNTKTYLCRQFIYLYIYYTETQRDVCLEGHHFSSKAWEILVVKCRNCQIHLISNKKCYTLCWTLCLFCFWKAQGLSPEANCSNSEFLLVFFSFARRVSG